MAISEGMGVRQLYILRFSFRSYSDRLEGPHGGKGIFVVLHFELDLRIWSKRYVKGLEVLFLGVGFSCLYHTTLFSFFDACQ